MKSQKLIIFGTTLGILGIFVMCWNLILGIWITGIAVIFQVIALIMLAKHN